MWGWPHRIDGDGGDAPHWSDVTVFVLGERGTGVRPPFEGSAVLFRGCGARSI
jgi:hypothetical protein